MKPIGLALSILGAILGIVGSLLMAHAYHLNKAIWGIAKNSLSVGWAFLIGGLSKARKHVELDARFAQLNPEDRAVSLAGVYLLFWSFCFQLVGAILSY